VLATNKEGIFPVNYVKLYDNVEVPLDDDGNEVSRGSSAAAQASTTAGEDEATARREAEAREARAREEAEKKAAADRAAADSAVAAERRAAAAQAASATSSSSSSNLATPAAAAAPAQPAASAGPGTPTGAGAPGAARAATELPSLREGRDGSSYNVLMHEAPTMFFTPDDNEFDPYVMAQVLRGAKEALTDEEMAKISSLYLSCDPELVHRYQVKAHEVLAEGAPVLYPSMMEKVMGFLSANQEDELSPDVPLVSLSKHSLDFGLPEPCAPLNKPLSDTVTLVNPNNKRAKWSIPAPAAAADYEIKFTPSSGSLGKGEKAVIKVELAVKRMTKSLHRLFPVEVADGLRHLLVLNLDSEKMVFGVPWDCVEMVPFTGAHLTNVMVPKVLVDLQRFLYERKALDVVGIFRLAADETEIPGIKRLINQGKFSAQSVKDVNCVSTLIKVFFREMPAPLLNVIPAEKFINAHSEDQCLALFDTLPEPNKGVFLWLLDLMADVAKNHQVNRMGTKAIAIVVAPNLFLPGKDEDPMKSLLVSQKTVNFVANVLVHRMRTLYGIVDV
jgi:hypothetical protein